MKDLSEMNKFLIEIFQTLFDLKNDEINDELTMETVILWDSLNHLRLITALEEEFGITFTMEQIEKMTSFGKVKKTIQIMIH